jgi:hypothetical protein
MRNERAGQGVSVYRALASTGNAGPISLPDHVVVFGERHLRHLLKSYQKYYNEARTHLSLQKDAPVPRAIQTVGRTLAMPVLGGLHHQYFRA